LFIGYALLSLFIKNEKVMLPEITKIKGVHPGAVLSRELKQRGLESKQFAISLGEHPQTINAISKGRRGINPALSIKIGNALGTNDDYFMLLQAYYEVEREHKKLLLNQQKPDLSKFRTVLFWDTDMNLLNWEKQRKAIIQRIFERGNESEIKEIIAFYGKEIVMKELRTCLPNLPSLSKNAAKFVGLNLMLPHETK